MNSVEMLIKLNRAVNSLNNAKSNLNSAKNILQSAISLNGQGMYCNELSKLDKRLQNQKNNLYIIISTNR